jgi:hypothetical protein
MATILDFQRKSVNRERPGGDGKPCQVVFFTGVRYERANAADRSTSETGQRRPPEASANLTV